MFWKYAENLQENTNAKVWFQKRYKLTYLQIYIIIRSNLRVAQNGRFVINSVYSGGGTMVAKILDFKLPESQKMCSKSPFALPNYP